MNTAMELMDKLSDTSQSHYRCSVVEVMGRGAGYIALNTGVASGALEALGEGIPSFIISLLRYLVLIVPAASIGSRMFGITGVWASFPVAEMLTAAAAAGIFTARYRTCLKRL